MKPLASRSASTPLFGVGPGSYPHVCEPSLAPGVGVGGMARVEAEVAGAMSVVPVAWPPSLFVGGAAAVALAAMACSVLFIPGSWQKDRLGPDATFETRILLTNLRAATSVCLRSLQKNTPKQDAIAEGSIKMIAPATSNTVPYTVPIMFQNQVSERSLHGQSCHGDVTFCLPSEPASVHQPLWMAI